MRPRRGKFRDMVNNKKMRVYRAYKTDVVAVDQMKIDLIQVLAEEGINFKKIHTISKKLVDKGWIKVKRVELPQK